MATDVVLPQMGLEVSEGIVLEVHVSLGDEVDEGDPLVELETDKAVTEVAAPHAGVVLAIEVEAGDTIPVGRTLARIGEPGETTVDATPAPERGAASSQNGAHRIKAAPLARRAAAKLGVELDGLEGTGPGKRITLGDVELAAERLDRSATAAPPSVAPAPAGEVRPMSATRAAIARRMTESQRIPQYTLSRDVDAGWLLSEKSRLKAEGSVRVGVVDLLVQALAEAVVRHPALADSYVEAAEAGAPGLRSSDGVDVGLAVATERGLLVPVIRSAHERPLERLVEDRGLLVEAARAGRLGLEEMTGATITLSSLGTFGVDRFTAMLNPGESAILAAGRTIERAVPRDRGLVVAPMLGLTMTFDHRVVDGAGGAAALAELAELLEGGMEWRM